MAKQGSDSSSMELSHYVAVLRRRWKYVAACFALGVVLAGAVVVMSTTRSTSTTLLNVDVIAANAFSASRPASDLIDAPTEQAMVRSTQVMTDVAADLGGAWTKASVRANTEATMLPDGTVLRIEFTADSAEQAARGASLIADKYLSYRTEAANERVTLASDRLVERREELSKQLAAVNRSAAEAVAGSAEQLAAELDRQRISEELSSVTSQLSDLQAINTSGGQVVTEADANQVVTSPNRLVLLLSGALGGLLLGLVLAFVVNILDRRVRDGYDVVGAGGVDVLARLKGPRVELPASGYDVDQVRALRERLMSTVEARRPVLTVVEVAVHDTAPSDLAANLAVSLSDSGLTTDLVLADYPPAALEEVVGSLAVREITPLGHARRFRGGVSEALTVVVPDGTGTRLSTSDLLAELVADDVRVAECTVVGVAPGAGDSARLTAGRTAHELVFAVHESATTIDDLAAVAGDLQAVRASVLGTVLLPRERLLGTERAEDTGGTEGTEGVVDADDAVAGSAPEQGGPVPSGAASEVAGERARSLTEASRKGRLRAGNTAGVSTAANRQQWSEVPPVADGPVRVVRVVEPVIVPVEPPLVPSPESSDEVVDETDQIGQVDEDGQVDAAVDEGAPGSPDSGEADSGESDSADLHPEEPHADDSGGEEPPTEQEPTLVRDDPPPPREPGSLPWAFSR